MFETFAEITGEEGGQPAETLALRGMHALVHEGFQTGRSPPQEDPVSQAKPNDPVHAQAPARRQDTHPRESGGRHFIHDQHADPFGMPHAGAASELALAAVERATVPQRAALHAEGPEPDNRKD